MKSKKEKDIWDKLSLKENTKSYQECTTCGEKGHTYIACQKINFFQAFVDALKGK